MKSKTKIEKQSRRKTNKELVEIILKAKKQKAWLKVAEILSGPRRKMPEINLERINSDSKEGDIVIVPGKVLGVGEIEKKIKIAAFRFSESAREKLKNKKCEIRNIEDEIKSNPEGKGIKILS